MPFGRATQQNNEIAWRNFKQISSLKPAAFHQSNTDISDQLIRWISMQPIVAGGFQGNIRTVFHFYINRGRRIFPSDTQVNLRRAFIPRQEFPGETRPISPRFDPQFSMKLSPEAICA
jgi:hypothetical protein